MDDYDLADYAQSNIEQVLARVPGVGEVEIFASQYAMRVWLNPDKLTDYQLTMEDVIAAIRPTTWRFPPASSAGRRRWKASG